MTEDDCRRVLALWGLTDLEQAVGRDDWPWWKNLLRDSGPASVCVSKHARLPDFTKDDAAAAQLMMRMGATVEGHYDCFVMDDGEIIGRTLGGTLLAALRLGVRK